MGKFGAPAHTRSAQEASKRAGKQGFLPQQLNRPSIEIRESCPSPTSQLPWWRL